MKKNLFKLSLFLSLAFILISPIMVGAKTYDPVTGREIQTLEEFNKTDPATLARVADLGKCVGLEGIGKMICQIHRILNTIIPVLMTLGVLYFIWGVVQYMIGGGDEAKKKGRDHIIYGLIGLAVIVGVWGLVNIVTNTFGLTGDTTVPQLVPFDAAGKKCDLSGTPKFQDLLCYVTKIINDSIIPLIFTLAVLMFVWGVVQHVINSSDEAKKEKGRQFMLWGIIALTVMVAVWGLVAILGSTFGISTGVLPQVKLQK